MKFSKIVTICLTISMVFSISAFADVLTLDQIKETLTTVNTLTAEERLAFRESVRETAQSLTEEDRQSLRTIFQEARQLARENFEALSQEERIEAIQNMRGIRHEMRELEKEQWEAMTDEEKEELLAQRGHGRGHHMGMRGMEKEPCEDLTDEEKEELMAQRGDRVSRRHMRMGKNPLMGPHMGMGECINGNESQDNVDENESQDDSGSQEIIDDSEQVIKRQTARSTWKRMR